MSEPRKVPGRAFTDEKKRAVVEKILAAWTSPKGRALRLGQLISNAGAVNPYTVEDSELVDLVERYVGE